MVDIKNLRLDDWLCMGDNIPVQVGLIMDGRVDTMWDIGLANIFLTDEIEAKEKRVLHIKDLSYVELTADIMIQLGFNHSRRWDDDVYHIDGLDNVWFKPSGVFTVASPERNHVIYFVQYVHELQHVLKDLGNDKEIKLSGHSIVPEKPKSSPFFDYIETLDTPNTYEKWRVTYDVAERFMREGKNPDEYLEEIRHEVETIMAE